MWYNEVNGFTCSPANWGDCWGTPVIGHYSQVVWADVEKIGCGIVKYNGGILVGCQYYPQGNYRSRKMYEEGKGASKCPSGYDNKCDGLCSNKKCTGG